MSTLLPLVLYVDDEHENLTGFKFTFRKQYRIILANSGEEALVILGKQQENEDPVALVLTDQRMPQMTGVEFLTRVAQEFPDTMRMVVTGFSDVNAVMEAINKGGAFRYMTKPWNTQELQEAMDQALSHYRLRTENARLFKELSGSERKMSTLLSHLPGMVYQSYAQPHWMMRFASEGCEGLTGISSANLIAGKTRYFDLIEAEYQPLVTQAWTKAAATKVPFDIMYPIKGKGMARKWVLEKGVAIEEDGERILESLVLDITALREAEENLKGAMSELQELKVKLEEENLYLKQEVKTQHSFSEIISASPLFKKILRQIEQVAPSTTTVLILGETGTGKELLARAVHHISARSKENLVKVNCAALPANLIESELFGHEKGSFTGAIARKIGRFEMADKGTIFLDEVGELPLDLQSKLLRALQEGEIERVGGDKTIKVDVRIVAATNRDLLKEVEQGRFRADLYYRLNVFPIKTPPLRERREDIAPLVKHFVTKYSKKIGKSIEAIPKEVMTQLETYPWPGNVRELENIIERSVIISSAKRLELGDWLHVGQQPSFDGGKIVSLDNNERMHILRALKLTNWRVSGEKGAAKLLEINDRTLQSRMRKLKIKRES